jgi:hypothetical protein
MPEKSFLDRAADHAFAELKRVGGDPARLPVPLQTVVLIYSAQGVIDNGGFEYFFGMDFDLTPPYSLISNAYRRIDEAADCIDRAVELFPFENPHLFKGKRNEFMESQTKSSEIVDLGDRLCGDETIWSKLEAYAGQHEQFFAIH